MWPFNRFVWCEYVKCNHEKCDIDSESVKTDFENDLECLNVKCKPVNTVHFNETASLTYKSDDVNVGYPPLGEQSASSVHENETNLFSANLKVLCWNIQGLGCKFESHDLLNKVSEYDVVVFLETMKLDSYCPDTGTYIFKHFQRKFQNPRARKPGL